MRWTGAGLAPLLEWSINPPGPDNAVVIRLRTCTLMGDALILDDGRTLSRSSMAIAGVLYLTAEQLTEEDHQLRRWLKDVSDRPNGFASVDLRGLTANHRTAFHKAARAAFAKLATRDGIADNGSVTYEALTDLVAMLDSLSRGDPPATTPTDYVSESSPTPEDLNQIWKADSD